MSASDRIKSQNDCIHASHLQENTAEMDENNNNT